MNGAPIKRAGFTIVELLIVIVVLAILAMVTIVGYNGAQERAHIARAKSDISSIVEVTGLAQLKARKNLIDITGNNWTARYCVEKPAGTDLATLPDTDQCIVDYKTAISAISAAAGVDLEAFRDPWGRPYLIDENEDENYIGDCVQDTVAMFSYPLNGNVEHGESNHPATPIENVPFGGHTGCL